MEAQATRRVLLENCELVTKREDLRLQGGTGSKTGGYQSEKGDQKRAHRGSTRTSRMLGTAAFSDRTEFSVITGMVRLIGHGMGGRSGEGRSRDAGLAEGPLPLRFATQMLVPSNLTVRGPYPTGYVPITAPVLAWSL
jgi:hypothetical protein